MRRAETSQCICQYMYVYLCLEVSKYFVRDIFRAVESSIVLSIGLLPLLYLFFEGLGEFHESFVSQFWTFIPFRESSHSCFEIRADRLLLFLRIRFVAISTVGIHYILSRSATIYRPPGPTTTFLR